MGCTKDYKKAVEYYKLAVLRGCDDAHLSLSVIYEKGGFGTEIDLKKSFKHLLKSKYSKSPEGCIQIAKIYANGKGVEKNINLCKEYILKAQKKNPYIFIPQELQKFLNEKDNQAKKGVNNLETKQEQPSTQMKQRNENENNRKSASKLESKSKSDRECESEHQEIELKQPRHFELETKKPIFSSLFTFGSIIVVSSICLYNELKSNSKNNKNNLDN
ncbi:sel-1-like protein [Anaeramoeba flamelloides]|uniref:Sel-1-like protein n=1 Tax=Anaeramoeba flamelloides TaxID=1746091 RepID=A0ABQ8Z259_9EUKA|nr:sel-1-like protein [Anaeramoeba flamelloides]